MGGGGGLQLHKGYPGVWRGEEQRMKAGWIHPASSPSSGSLPVQNLDDCCEQDRV